MGWVTELRSFFISRQKMTSVHAINHTTVSSKFHSLNEITWELEHGVPSRAKSHTLSSKTRPARKHPPYQCTQTDTHTQLHSHRKSCFTFTINGSLFSTAKPFNHPTDTVSHHCSYRLRIAYIPLLCDTGYSADGGPQTTRATACVFLCVCLAPSRDGRAWRSTGTRLHGSDQ